MLSYVDRSRTALMLAALNGHTEMFRYLLERGHDDHHISQDYEKHTVLIIAAEHNRQEVGAIFVLYARRFPQCMDMADDTLKTPLMYAAQHGCDGIVEFLLDNGQSPDKTDQDGSTALHYASAYGHIKTVRLLIIRDCRYTIRNKFCWSANDWAYSLLVQAELESTLWMRMHAYIQ
ncbi:ankyrin repeat-containing domain protein [Thamnocephalis sphaerospora]|uniref:Ankyrin repeat-containing domain protein n=1 Tax=Thamnocephalis sphaerospora TaxID=78915 RepID=A0A4P9XGT9_9FUNG|nr:ankyrin repeat-containing domain protein [Thamnocephalis sphaerospora]|eukprot:RKP04390.1 ankyrin repeat-containing domain protein [Thamnocephalis sphaerospora]